MTCPLKMFGNPERYYASCEFDCAFKTETGCLLAEGLKTYIDIHKTCLIYPIIEFQVQMKNHFQ